MPDIFPSEIILASASPRREDLLRQIGLDFRVVRSGFDESTVIPWPPEEHVVQSASGKAGEVASQFLDGIIIGADTIVVVEDQILGKPVDPADARRMLRMLSGREHHVYTGLCVIQKIAGISRAVKGHERTEVRFGPLTNEMIDCYVATGEPLDKAGAYGIQDRGSVLIEGISGDYFNVVGLPVFRLSRILLNLGVPLFPRCSR